MRGVFSRSTFIIMRKTFSPTLRRVIRLSVDAKYCLPIGELMQIDSLIHQGITQGLTLRGPTY